MKNSSRQLNTIFAVAEEKIKNKGEDSLFYKATDNKFILAAFDGCGGSGSKKYVNYSEKTGAYIASRAICGGIMSWFDESGKKETISEYTDKALSVCTKYADKTSRIMGSLGKTFPTTLSVLTGELQNNKVNATCYWAGDSRCYILDAEGLHQLTDDDLDDQDAMSNLTSDGIMNNSINASSSYKIHVRSLSFAQPSILFTATDGCFGYYNSPMAFEYLLTETLTRSSCMLEWKKLLYDGMYSVAGDDFTLCAAVYGFQNFEDIRSTFAKRCRYVYDNYINTAEDLNKLWDIYKPDYSKYL